MPYGSKDVSPYKTAGGTPFDDRDYAGSEHLPGAVPAGQPSAPGRPLSFPYHPCVPDAERNVKVPAWLNDVSLYHNRGDTTFIGENSLYGDFFGLDDLFTENPRVVDGMIDIYKALDPRLPHRRLPDGHDEARQRRVLAEVRAGDRRLREVAGHPRLLHVRRGGRGLQPAVPVALHDARRGAGRAGLPVPDGGDALRRATRGRPTTLRDVLRQRRLVHRRRLERLQPADVPRQPRPRARRHVPARRQPGRDRSRAAGARPSSRTR